MALVQIKRSGQMLGEGASPLRDMIGKSVFDRDGRPAGRVVSLLLDLEHRRIRYAEMVRGGILNGAFGRLISPTLVHNLAGLSAPGRRLFFGKSYLIPVSALAIVDGGVALGKSAAELASAPAFRPQREIERDGEQALFSFYGVVPYWRGIGSSEM